METAGSFCFFFLFRLNNSALQLSLPADANYCTECTGYSFAIIAPSKQYYFLKNIHIAELFIHIVRHVTGNDKDYLRKIPRVVW